MLEHELLAFSGDATACPNADTLRRHVLELLAVAVPSDTAVFVSLTGHGLLHSPVHRNKCSADFNLYRLFAANPTRYSAWTERSRAASATHRGAYCDVEVFSSHDRDRSPFYAEIVQPQGICKQIVASVRFRGKITGSIHLERYALDPEFTERELAIVRDLLPSIGVTQAALERSPAGTAGEAVARLRSRFVALSRRERQLAELVMRGLSNREIAAQCNTSGNTVRNQLSRIFDKLGASSRAELASWAASVADDPAASVLFEDSKAPV
jgi:DNA-binding CsgD family transcriptional regulator